MFCEETVNKAHHLFYHLLKKNFLKFCLFSINLCKFALVNHVRSHRGRKQTQAYSLHDNAETRRGWDELLMRSGLTVGNHLWIRRLLDALFLTLRNLVNFTYCQGTWQR